MVWDTSTYISSPASYRCEGHTGPAALPEAQGPR
ncbi:hypothetical protein MC885_006971 [Smutsia gigantea]|nr:hypothetical protein MC885_006971 [Smutsia gigantea]